MSQPLIKIYSLNDPNTDEVRYVGKTVQRLSARLAFHIYISGIHKNYKSSWIKGLLRKGLKPYIRLIEHTNEFNWENREKYWINYYRNIGIKLTNLSDGGDGPNGFKHTEEAKKIIGEKAKLRICSDSYRKKLSLTKVGELNPQSKLTEQAIEKIKEMLILKIYQWKIAKCFDVTQSHISRIKTGAYLKEVKYYTRYGGERNAAGF